MTMIVVDANILIAAMYTHDVHHVVASRFLKNAGVADRLCIPILNLAEALVSQVRLGQGNQAETAIKAAGIELLDGNLVDPLGLACLRASTGLKLPDCVVLASAQKLGAALATTDKQLARVAATVGVTSALPAL